MANTFRNAINADLPVVLTNIYTAPAATQSVIHSIYLSNIHATNDAAVTIEVEQDALNKVKIASQVNVPNKSSIALSKPVNLEAGHKLNAAADTSGTAAIFVSVLEIA